MRRNVLVLTVMVMALALMIAAGVMNYRQRRREQQAHNQAMQLRLVPANGDATSGTVDDTNQGDNLAASEAPYTSPLNGKPAPTFTLQDLSGKPVSLASFKGRPLVVDFWATWCEPCKVEIPWFEKLHDQYAKDGLEILGVSTDDLDRDDPAKLFTQKRDISDFVTKMHMNYPILLSAESVEDQYHIDATPTTFFIDRNGRIVASTVGLASRDEIEADIRKALGGANS